MLWIYSATDKCHTTATRPPNKAGDPIGTSTEASQGCACQQPGTAAGAAAAPAARRWSYPHRAAPARGWGGGWGCEGWCLCVVKASVQRKVALLPPTQARLWSLRNTNHNPCPLHGTATCSTRQLLRSRVVKTSPMHSWIGRPSAIARAAAEGGDASAVRNLRRAAAAPVLVLEPLRAASRWMRAYGFFLLDTVAIALLPLRCRRPQRWFAACILFGNTALSLTPSQSSPCKAEAINVDLGLREGWLRR